MSQCAQQGIKAKVYASPGCHAPARHAPAGTQCGTLVETAYNDLKDINLYDILWTCYHGSAPRQQALAQARAGPQGRSWPLGGSVRPGLVPTWTHLLGAELGHVPPCLDSRWVTKSQAWLTREPSCEFVRNL